LHAQRAVIAGRGHPIPATGAPYNQRLGELLGGTPQRSRAAEQREGI
jgi:hypothetical protein